MINDDKANKALEQMKYDIELTICDFSNIDLDKCPWTYYICIIASDDESLIYASKLLQMLNIRAKNILLVPKSYKYCSFDCITISNIFNSIKAFIHYNAEYVSILDCDNNLNNGDFYICIVKQNDDGTNEIATYQSLKTIINNL